MGKKKKVTEKVILFYRGPLTKPSKIADEQGMQIIARALEDCVGRRDCAFTTCWRGRETALQLVVGLSSGLRCLKQRRALALIYDDTAAPHLTKYLIHFADKNRLPIVQAHRLIDLAPKYKLKTMLLVSIVDTVRGDEDIYREKPRLKPKPVKEIIVSEAFDKLSHFIQSSSDDINQGESGTTTLRPPVLSKVPSTGRSKAKKEAKRKLRQEKIGSSGKLHVESK